jgi:hypothetical protein
LLALNASSSRNTLLATDFAVMPPVCLPLSGIGAR